MLYRFGGLGSIGKCCLTWRWEIDLICLPPPGLLVASLYVVGDLIAAGM